MGHWTAPSVLQKACRQAHRLARHARLAVLRSPEGWPGGDSLPKAALGKNTPGPEVLPQLGEPYRDEAAC